MNPSGLSTAERELKRTTLRALDPRGAGTHRGLHDAAACLYTKASIIF